jgi:hypothetical protein
VSFTKEPIIFLGTSGIFTILEEAEQFHRNIGNFLQSLKKTPYSFERMVIFTISEGTSKRLRNRIEYIIPEE